jgi:predicted RNA-binding Zn ribbon-like protein
VNGLELANTLVRGHRGVVDRLDPALGLHPLRDAIRELFDAAAAGTIPPPSSVELVNRLARAPRLAWDARGPALVPEDAAAEAARTAVELLAAGRVHRCGNPRCVHFFVAGTRREYCSDACANRTRVARHAAHRRSL